MTTHPDYRGVNHSRMTAAMEDQLHDSPRAFLVLSRLRRLVGDGGRIQLYGGVRGWARFLGCAAGAPKAILNRLAYEGFITVQYQGDGFADVVVAPVMVEQDQPVIETKPTAQTACERSETAQTAEPGRSVSDPIRHESCTKQQQRATPLLSEIPDSPPESPLYRRLMSQPTMHEPTARQIAESPPGSLVDFEADLLAASVRPGIENPFWLTVAAWMRQSRVSARKPYAPPDCDRPDRPRSDSTAGGGDTRSSGTRRRATTELTPGGVTPNWPEQSEIDRINAEYHAAKERKRLARLSAVQGARDITDRPADAAAPACAGNLPGSRGCASPGAGSVSAVSVCPA